MLTHGPAKVSRSTLAPLSSCSVKVCGVHNSHREVLLSTWLWWHQVVHFWSLQNWKQSERQFLSGFAQTVDFNTSPVILWKRPTGASARAIGFRFSTYLKATELFGVYVGWRNHLSTLLWPCWSRKWQPTPIFLPGEFHGKRSLVGYSPWGHKESEKTEWLTLWPCYSLPALPERSWYTCLDPWFLYLSSRRHIQITCSGGQQGLSLRFHKTVCVYLL